MYGCMYMRLKNLVLNACNIRKSRMEKSLKRGSTYNGEDNGLCACNLPLPKLHYPIYCDPFVTSLSRAYLSSPWLTSSMSSDGAKESNGGPLLMSCVVHYWPSITLSCVSWILARNVLSNASPIPLVQQTLLNKGMVSPSYFIKNNDKFCALQILLPHNTIAKCFFLEYN